MENRWNIFVMDGTFNKSCDLSIASVCFACHNLVSDAVKGAVLCWNEPKMSEYNRTTRECPVSQLDAEVHQAFRKYFQEHQLGNLEAETLRCCETISRRKNAGGLFSRLNASADTTIHTGIILTSQWLIWARRGDKSGTRLTAANLNQISVQEHVSFFSDDHGLEVLGYIEDSNRAMRGYIGMGSELATQKFCDEVKQAIARVNPPVKRGWPKWMGG
jgi:hypothetical protein